LTLTEWQKAEVIRPLFGWIDRQTGLRRFNELYLLTGKGSGKTPLITMLALYLMLGSKQHGVNIISCASDFTQANKLSFGDAKRFIDQSPELKTICDSQQFAIHAPRDCHWTVISGKPKGRSGFRPTCILADEIHEFQPWTFEGLSIISQNLFKRPNSLLMIATNAGSNRTGDAWRKHERALKVLNGQSNEETLLPVIHEAPPDLQWDSEEAANAGNPSLGSFVHFSQLAPKLVQAREDPAEQAEYERLYLSRWVQGGKKWLDMKLWDQATGEIDPMKLKDTALFVGLDMSMGDDLCAAAYCYATPTRLHIDAEFWLPQATADHYQRTAATPYKEWGEQKAIHLLPDRTISPEVCQQIANSIIARHKVTPIKAVCYDAYRASHTIAALEAAGITCVAIRQGFSVSPGCEELDRRLKDGSITITANPVLRAHAEVVETTGDARGNRWICKPLANAGFAGRRSAKVDGIASIVTALVEARKHTFPKKSSSAVKAYVL
jgi:phage terminase large subunit-like protein